MLTLNDVLYSTTNRISSEFEEDIFVDDTVQGFEKSCFFVEVKPVTNLVATSVVDRKSILIAIKYMQDSKGKRIDLNDILNRLEKIFNRVISVKERHLTISSIESDILKDEVGYTLDYLISLDYFDEIYIEEKEEFEPMSLIGI